MKTALFVRCYARAVKEQKMTSSMWGYEKDAARISGVVSMDFLSGVYPGKSAGSIYMHVWIYENNVKKSSFFSYLYY